MARDLLSKKHPSSEQLNFEKGFPGGSREAFFSLVCLLRPRQPFPPVFEAKARHGGARSVGAGASDRGPAFWGGSKKLDAHVRLAGPVPILRIGFRSSSARGFLLRGRCGPRAGSLTRRARLPRGRPLARPTRMRFRLSPRMRSAWARVRCPRRLHPGKMTSSDAMIISSCSKPAVARL